MDYRPNVDGMVWFCREVLPRVRAEVPGATLTICGSSPDKAVRALAGQPGVTVTGAVPDVRPYLDAATGGRGAAADGPRHSEQALGGDGGGPAERRHDGRLGGHRGRDGRDLFVADEPADFAAAVVRLLRDRRLRDEIGAAGRAAVEADYRWERTLTRLEEVVEEAAASGACQRPGLLSCRGLRPLRR